MLQFNKINGFFSLKHSLFWIEWFLISLTSISLAFRRSKTKKYRSCYIAFIFVIYLARYPYQSTKPRKAVSFFDDGSPIKALFGRSDSHDHSGNDNQSNQKKLRTEIIKQRLHRVHNDRFVDSLCHNSLTVFSFFVQIHSLVIIDNIPSACTYAHKHIRIHLTWEKRSERREEQQHNHKYRSNGTYFCSRTHTRSARFKKWKTKSDE